MFRLTVTNSLIDTNEITGSDNTLEVYMYNEIKIKTIAGMISNYAIGRDEAYEISAKLSDGNHDFDYEYLHFKLEEVDKDEIF